MANKILRWDNCVLPDDDTQEYSLVAHALDKQDAIRIAAGKVRRNRKEILEFMEKNSPVIDEIFESPYAEGSFSIFRDQADATGLFE